MNAKIVIIIKFLHKFKLHKKNIFSNFSVLIILDRKRMANHQSAKKRIRTSEKRRLRNKASLSKVKTLMKKVFDSKDKSTGETSLKEAVAFLDKTASKGRLHKNNVARKKARLTKFVNALEEK
jgi:small subunit ribosomal protein S20